MADTDVAPVVTRLAALIGTVTNIGKVHEHDIYDHDDMRDLVVSTIGGTPTLRAWYVVGPVMAGNRAEQREAGYVRRRWTYTIHGIEGLDANNTAATATLRDNAVKVMDAIDADFDLNGTCFLTEPCAIVDEPATRLYPVGACAHVAITKPVITLSTPS